MAEERTIAFDTETYLFDQRPKGSEKSKVNVNPVPELVCLSYYGEAEDSREYDYVTDLLKKEEAVQWWVDAIQNDDIELVGHNLAFDNVVMLRAAYEVTGEDYTEEVFEAYDDALFSCTAVRQKLIDIATTGLRRRFGKYSLENMAEYHLENANFEEKSGPEAWRLRYAELAPYPLRVWPEAAVKYAKKDAEYTFKCWQKQKKRKGRSLHGFSIANEYGAVNEHLQNRADFGFALMSSWGIRVDQTFAKDLEARYEDRLEKLETKLQEFGLVTDKGKENQKEKRRIFEKAFEESDAEKLETPTGKTSTSKKARNRLKEAGYTSEKMDTLVEYNRVKSYLSGFIEPIRLAENYALCPNYNVLVATGRSSCSKPNMQQMPKRDKEHEEIPSSLVRKCFTPREDHTFITADWSSAELRTLSQVNLNLGFEPVEMAEAFKNGVDVHLDFAAQIAEIDYEEALNRYQDGDDEIDELRFVSKIANFGFPVGMGASKFVAHAREKGVWLTLEQSEELREKWLDRWEEMNKFFDHISKLKHQKGGYPIQQHPPGGGKQRPNHRWRCRNAFKWTEAGNSFFQGMAADGAKYSLWQLQKESRTDPESPLYGYRVSQFIHDEFLVEGPREGVYGAAERLREVMIQGLRIMTPDIPVEVDVQVADKWGEGKEF